MNPFVIAIAFVITGVLLLIAGNLPAYYTVTEVNLIYLAIFVFVAIIVARGFQEK